MRFLIGLGGLILAVLLLWIAALTLLPDARVATTRPIAVDPSTVQTNAGGGDVLEVPIAGIARSALADSWGDPRDNGLRPHHGIDIMAPSMTPVRAAASGTIEKLFQSRAGGTTIYLRTPQRDWTLYYAHLASYAPGLREGQAVRSGDVLGSVGDTGDAGPGNYHLHFGLTRTTPDQHWYQGEDVDPYPYLARQQPLR
ncbi:MAG: peptidase [Sphingomonas bacterium]|uniref:M23 family metallopeptidase n=1 Tax=Sphingomonas bacterium TaxID=1895847 RepID=UPI00261022F7|nr:M23 family metallopeptidase [Sphingomonas bacterium]MDB5711343.1 peptidase [Sphingomonas bacterium]